MSSTAVSGLNAAQANQKWLPCTIGSSFVPASGPVRASPRMLHADPVCSSMMTPPRSVKVRRARQRPDRIPPLSRPNALAPPRCRRTAIMYRPCRRPPHRALRPCRLSPACGSDPRMDRRPPLRRYLWSAPAQGAEDGDRHRHRIGTVLPFPIISGVRCDLVRTRRVYPRFA